MLKNGNRPRKIFITSILTFNPGIVENASCWIQAFWLCFMNPTFILLLVKFICCTLRVRFAETYSFALRFCGCTCFSSGTTSILVLVLSEGVCTTFECKTKFAENVVLQQWIPQNRQLGHTLGLFSCFGHLLLPILHLRYRSAHPNSKKLHQNQCWENMQIGYLHPCIRPLCSGKHHLQFLSFLALFRESNIHSSADQIHMLHTQSKVCWDTQLCTQVLWRHLLQQWHHQHSGSGFQWRCLYSLWM